MDEPTLIRTYGNTDLPEGTPDRPLVTFAVFAYNQEKYIREAVEGAFSQTYSPLEIILSDDCSSDRTFEIMDEMAREYVGPHLVKVRRNRFNVGTALHVQYAFDESSGRLFVLAAGDDISMPERVKKLIAAWEAAGFPEGAVHSGRETFRDGQIIAQMPAKRNGFTGRELEGTAKAQWLPAAAPTCAYTRGIFERFAPLMAGGIIEDAPLFLRVALIGQFVACDEPLMRQRLHDENTGTGYSVATPARWNRFMQSKLIAFRTMQRDLAGWTGEIDPVLRCRIEQRILEVLRSVSGLILPETRPIDPLERLRLALRIATALAVASSFRLRVEYALSFLGLEWHLRLKDSLRPLLGDQRTYR